MKQKLREKLTYANVMVTILTFVVFGGVAYAAFKVPPNSVGTRQLKARAVTNGKIANATITGAKVAEGTLSGADINMAELGVVPQAASASHAGNSDTVGGHAASCPTATTLIRGLCYDTSSEEAPNLNRAAEACAAKGGYLPSPMQLYSIKEILNLGTGVGTEHQYTDEVYANTAGGNYSTVVVDGTGAITEQSITSPSHFICVYPLVR